MLSDHPGAGAPPPRKVGAVDPGGLVAVEKAIIS